ncbi:hypothetical protein G7B40_022380 [Aetokthonos hydrillicola Thurmond2011]|uniref:Uncharacterized protein n=1 Tax=Aetokthonos hydrillicola Thurmond2011 TaxID=2712845 RepID=A0AAP5M6R2_9CYAN|nr:hypothetical protein [Aetokthonos hydrillicola]MBO3460767.1 hypothetical protein [Aetokthonos hydrillicola CCALA 1050]MBW4585364.1 hypothetical protein [Aetokthonos hydrillicola CCALA 1050]MDR9897291.1 hypothetical protein [Aetokthonos hydrillicola Thurmond2011]
MKNTEVTEEELRSQNSEFRIEFLKLVEELEAEARPILVVEIEKNNSWVF